MTPIEAVAMGLGTAFVVAVVLAVASRIAP